jgi:DNA processing protein
VVKLFYSHFRGNITLIFVVLLNTSIEIESALILSRLPGVGAATFKDLLHVHGTPSVALQHFSEHKTNKKTPLNIQEAVSFLEKNDGVKMFWPFHKSYPKSLSDITEPPPVLFIKGQEKILKYKKVKVAIVGARKASPAGLAYTKEIVKKYCQEGAVIVSGLAEGIDTCAHQVALEEGCETIAVMATGIDVCFPKKNQALYEEISSRGVICTEFFPGTPPMASFFPTRNRIIAALSDIIIMVEGTSKSGALYTVRNGLKFHKKVFVGDFNNHDLIKEGLTKAITLGAKTHH